MLITLDYPDELHMGHGSHTAWVQELHLSSDLCLTTLPELCDSCTHLQLCHSAQLQTLSILTLTCGLNF